MKDEKHALTFAEEMRADAGLLRRRFVRHTRPRGLLTLGEAIKLSEQMNRKHASCFDWTPAADKCDACKKHAFNQPAVS